MIHKKICLFAVALTALATTAQAITIVTSGPYEVSYTTPVQVMGQGAGAGSEGLWATTLQVTNLSGESANNPFTFNGQIGINGALHHEQFVSSIPPFNQVPTPTALSSGNSVVDSHFIRPAALTISAESEPTIDDGTSTEPGQFGGRTGYGGPLTANIALGTGANPPPATIDLAYLVYKAAVDFNFVIASGVGGVGDVTLQGMVPAPGGGEDTIPPVLDMVMIARDLRDDPPGGLVEALQLLATDETSASDALVWSGLMYDSGPGKNNPSAADAIMDSDGVVNWNPAGWRRGVHNWKATVADEAGNMTTGIALKVDLTVPEPATFAMLGLAMVGVVGVIRRRS